MIRDLRITVLAENTAGRRDLLAEHGLAWWIEADGYRVLFDTGQGMVLEHNARALGFELEEARAVVLSHGHYDHTGGLGGALACFRNAAVFAHPLAFTPKYACGGGSARSVGSPFHDLAELELAVAAVQPTRTPVAICPGVWATGEIPRANDFEDTGGAFFLDEHCSTPDPLLDDQAVYLESPQGIVVLLGCAHAGLVNTLDYVASLTGRDRIHAVLGGMHLVSASYERIARTETALQHYDVQVIGPAHCTGRKATTQLWQEFPGRCVECVAGSSFRFSADRGP